MKNKIVLVGMLLLLLLGIFTACGDASQPAPDGGLDSGVESSDGEGEAGTEEPSFANFTAEDIEGNQVDESIFSEYDLTMVNVWGTFCSPCIEEMPDLGEIHSAYEGGEFQIVGIVTDVLNRDLTVSQDMVDTAKEIVSETKADYLHLIPSEDLLYAGIASIRSIPFTFFVDENGNLVGDTYSGSKSKSKWEKIIESTLKEVQETED